MRRSKKVQIYTSVSLLFMLLLAFGHPVQAQVAGTGFIPDPPVSGGSIIFREDFGVGCPPIHVPNVDGESDWLLVDGNEIYLFVVFNPNVPCGVPPDGPVVDFNLGILPAGDYTLFRYTVPTSVTFPVNPDEFDPVFEIGFTVVAGPTAIPSLNALGLGLLAILLASVVGWRVFSARSVR